MVNKVLCELSMLIFNFKNLTNGLRKTKQKYYDIALPNVRRTEDSNIGLSGLK